MGLPIQGFNSQGGVHTPDTNYLAYNHTINGGTNRFLLVFAYVQGISSRGTISGVTYNGVGMFNYGGMVNIGTKTVAGLYYLHEPFLPAGNTLAEIRVTSTLTFSAIQDILCGAFCLANVYQDAPLQAFAATIGTSSSPSHSFPSNYSDYLLCAVGLDASNTGVTPAAGQTTLFDVTTSTVSRLAGSLETAAAGSTVGSFTLGASAAWGVWGAAVRGTPGRNFQIINN
jgi:hypothetical protein